MQGLVKTAAEGPTPIRRKINIGPEDLTYNQEDVNDKLENNPEFKQLFDRDVAKHRNQPGRKQAYDMLENKNSDKYPAVSGVAGGLGGGALGAGLAHLATRGRFSPKAIGAGGGLGAAGLGALGYSQAGKEQEQLRERYDDNKQRMDNADYVPYKDLLAMQNLENIYEK